MKTRGQFFRMNRLMSYSVMKPLLALVIMICIMTFLSDNFATSENFFNVLRQVSVNLCISVGRTLVILTGGIDLSVGSVLAISGAVAAGLFKNGLEWERAGLFIGFSFFWWLRGGVTGWGCMGCI
jgi:ribose transport system permease protein